MLRFMCVLLALQLVPTSSQRSYLVLCSRQEDPGLSGYFDTKIKLETHLGKGSVWVFNAYYGTLSAEALREFDAVLVTAVASWGNRTALGDALEEYITQGGGVVEMAFKGVPGLSLGGSWSHSVFGRGRRLLRNHATLHPGWNRSHPIMKGVKEFSGGTTSYRIHFAASTDPSIIAEWSDGLPLVAEKPGARSVGINFFPLSSDVFPLLYPAGNDGPRIMAQALWYLTNPQRKPAPIPTGSRWLILHTNPAAWAEYLIRDDLERTFGNGTKFEIFNAATGVPMLAYLKRFTTIIVTSNEWWVDPVAVGDVLAEYYEQGGGVVECMCNFAPDGERALKGKWLNYTLLANDGKVTTGTAHLGKIHDTTHPLVRDLKEFNSGDAGWRVLGASLVNGARVLAEHDDGAPLVVVPTTNNNRRDPVRGRLVTLGFFPPSAAITQGAWITGGAVLLSNAAKYADQYYRGVPYVAASWRPAPDAPPLPTPPPTPQPTTEAPTATGIAAPNPASPCPDTPNLDGSCPPKPRQSIAYHEREDKVTVSKKALVIGGLGVAALAIAGSCTCAIVGYNLGRCRTARRNHLAYAEVPHAPWKWSDLSDPVVGVPAIGQPGDTTEVNPFDDPLGGIKEQPDV